MDKDFGSIKGKVKSMSEFDVDFSTISSEDISYSLESLTTEIKNDIFKSRIGSNYFHYSGQDNPSLCNFYNSSSHTSANNPANFEKFRRESFCQGDLLKLLTFDEPREQRSDESGSQEGSPKFDKIFNYSGFIWGTRNFENLPWFHERRCLENVRSYKDLQEDDEMEGVLTYKALGVGLSFLDEVPQKNKFAAAKLTMIGRNLNNILTIKNHHFLRYINFSKNKLTDISCLSYCPYLTHLNVSSNRISKLLNFAPPYFLTYVNYSNNNIEEIPDLSEFWSITFLDVSKNQISKIEGILNLRFLKTLILSKNQITKIENLNNMRIENLDLHGNNISDFEYKEDEEIGLKTLRDLIWLDLSKNNLTTLKFLQGTNLKSLNISANNISNLCELHNLRSLRYLSCLDMRNNPLSNIPGYRQLCIDSTCAIEFLDNIYVEAEEKVSASIVFSPNLMDCAIAQYSTLTLLKNLNIPNITVATVPYDRKMAPLIILVGPYGGNKRSFIKKFTSKYPKHTYQGIMMTTQPCRSSEVSGIDFHHVTRDQFNEMCSMGEFLFVYELFGHSFGFPQSELVKAIEKRAVCIISANLTSALTAKMNTNPILILAMPSTPEIHERYLKEKYRVLYWDVINPRKSAVKLERTDTPQIISGLKEGRIARYTNDIYVQFTKNIIENVPKETCCKCTCDCWKHSKHYKDWEKLQRELEDQLPPDYEFNLYVPDDVKDQTNKLILNLTLKDREMYKELHQTNPGMFINTISTDFEEESFKKLLPHVKDAFKRYSQKEDFDLEKDPIHINMINRRLKDVLEELNICDASGLMVSVTWSISDEIIQHVRMCLKNNKNKHNINNNKVIKNIKDTALLQRKQAAIPKDPSVYALRNQKITIQDIINKYDKEERLDPLNLPESKCPKHLLYSIYRAFTEN